MSDNRQPHRRRSVRLKGYDYAQPGAYFVTVCTHLMECLFGAVVDGAMVLNPLGRIVEEEWIKTANLRSYVELDEYVVMPNHVHGIIMIVNGRGLARYAPTQQCFGKMVLGSLPTILRAFKSAATKRMNALRGTPGQPVWQRNYYEHIIRNNDSVNHIREYIHYNPQRRHLDRYNLDASGHDEFDRWLEGSDEHHLRP